MKISIGCRSSAAEYVLRQLRYRRPFNQYNGWPRFAFRIDELMTGVIDRRVTGRKRYG
jgi:hypothetical protein